MDIRNKDSGGGARDYEDPNEEVDEFFFLGKRR